MPAERKQETSVFIQDPSQQRGSVSGRPLLRSSTSSNNVSPQTPPRDRIYLKVFLFVLVVLLTVTITVLIIIFTAKDTNSKQSPSFCIHYSQNKLESRAHHHPMCAKPMKVTQSCEGREEHHWRIFLAGFPEFHLARKLLTNATGSSFTSLMVSPLYKMSPKPCAIRLSFSLGRVSYPKVMVVSEKNNGVVVDVTQRGSCHHGIIENEALLKQMPSFRIIILNNDSAIPKEIQVSVTTHTCVSYESIGIRPVVTSKPAFALARRGIRNLCSMEIFNRKIHCDWWIVKGMGNAHFIRDDDHSCVERGVRYRKDDGYSWYLMLNGTHRHTGGYLISPVIHAGGSDLILSLWYIAQCNGTEIKIYIVPSPHDIRGIGNGIYPSVILRNEERKKHWKFNFTEISIPTSYDTFQVVIEGVLKSDGSCDKQRCHAPRSTKGKQVRHPLLAIDEIALEMRNDLCNVTGALSSSVIDCTFETDRNTSTLCSWSSSKNGFTIPKEWPSFSPEELGILNIQEHWFVTNVAESNDGHGATRKHLENRGYVIKLDATGKAKTHAYVRSPVLIGNSNCTCTMSFLYLVRGIFAPRLQVNLVLGGNKNDESRILAPQWSVFGHQSDEWLLSSVPLNIHTTQPFQVELRVLDIRDSRSDVHIDDIFFQNCDFRRV